MGKSIMNFLKSMRKRWLACSMVGWLRLDESSTTMDSCRLFIIYHSLISRCLRCIVSCALACVVWTLWSKKKATSKLCSSTRCVFIAEPTPSISTMRTKAITY